MRSAGELLYLLMVIGAFAIFTAVLAWVERTWQPKRTAEEPRTLNAHAVE
jgi:hypothetical protein